MLKTTTLWVLLLLCGGLATPAAAQSFVVDTLVKTGPLTKRINLVFVPDGYKASEMPLFISRVNQALTGLFSQTPFLEYRPYFNVFAIEVPSVESGSTHPRTATDCGTTPAFAANTYFNSTFDYGGIHRLVVPQAVGTLGTVLARNFPRYDQVFVLVNSAEYGGSGGQFATVSASSSAIEVAVHEIGHSFAGLADEYWAGPQYAIEKPNMTKNTNPTTVRWAPWIGTNGVGLYPHTTDASWYKPHQNCKMQYLGSPFCAVCREAFVERIHTLVSPVLAYSPAALAINAPTQTLPFALTLLSPANNTLRVTWTRDGVVFARNKAATTVPLAQLPVGNHVIRATVLDTTALTRSATHTTLHTYVVDWTINRTVTAVQLSSATTEYEVETYPNPVSDVLNINYTLPRSVPVSLTVLDAAGRTVKTIRYNRQAAGHYAYQLRRDELGLAATGVYSLVLHLNGVPVVRQVVAD